MSAAAADGSDTVHVLYKPETGTPTCDVLFFHGLQPVSYANAWEHTWQNDAKVLWPADWLGKLDFPNARVMSICYDSRAFKGQKEMDGIANILVNEICFRARVGQDRPVVLIGHSLGGLVLKKLALQAHKEAGLDGSILRDCCKAFCANLAGTFFYATPHGGAGLGSFARLALGTVRAEGPVLDYLTVFSSKGADLNRDFVMTFPTLCFMALMETKKYKPLGWLFPGVQVVPEGSGKQGMHNYVLMEADHISICKPKSTSDGTYCYLKEYLKAALAKFEDRQRVRETVRQQELQLSTATALEISIKENELQEKYTNKVQPALTWITRQKEQLEVDLGDRWAEGLFPHDKKVEELEVTKRREVMRDFWRDVLNLCDRHVLDDSFFKKANMAMRAHDYRMLVEPVEIANYYHANFHLDKPGKKSKGHYIDRITVELDDDNKIRPGRFRQLQQMELRVLGADDASFVTESSLGLARLLKERVGSRTWAEYKTQPEPADTQLEDGQTQQEDGQTQQEGGQAVEGN